MAKIKQQGQKWVHPRKECVNCDCTYDTNILMTDVQGVDVLSRKNILPNSQFG